MALSGHNNPASISELLALNISGRDLTRLACRSRSTSPRMFLREASASANPPLSVVAPRTELELARRATPTS